VRVCVIFLALRLKRLKKRVDKLAPLRSAEYLIVSAVLPWQRFRQPDSMLAWARCVTATASSRIACYGLSPNRKAKRS
jgi:hypothetical protein